MNADEHRAAQIQGLRDAAQFLADNPDVPIERYGLNPLSYSIGVHIHNDADGMAELRRIAGLLGVEVHDSRRGLSEADETHFYATRKFSGGITYQALYILRQEMADHREATKPYDEAMERLRAARAGGTSPLVEHPPHGADFTTATLARCRWAQVHGVSAAWSHGEQIAVALVLDDDSELAAMAITLDAARQVLADRFDSNIDHVIAWVDAVRAGLQGGESS